MPGGDRLHALDAGNRLWMIATHVPAREYDESALASGLLDLDWVSARAVRHERIVEHYLSAPALLPMQMFTLFTSDARALEHVTKERRRIDRILARVEGMREWGVRLSLDQEAARRAVSAGNGDAGRGRVSAEGPGATYLARKKEVRDAIQAQSTRARAAADRVHRLAARAASESRRHADTEHARGSRILLDGAYLVPASSTGAFKTLIRSQARELASAGVVVQLTGPWPPYNFVTAARSSRSPAGRTRA